MKAKHFLVAFLAMLIVPFAIGAANPFDGIWQKNNSWGEPYNDLRLSIDNPSAPGSYNELEMDGVGVTFSKIIARGENSVTLADDYGYTGKITYDPAGQTLKIKIFAQDGKTAIVNLSFDEKKHHLTMVVANDNCDIVSPADESVKIGVARKGEMFKYSGKSTYSGHEIVLPDGRKGIVHGNLSPEEPIDENVIGSEWVCSPDDGEDVRISLNIELLGDDMVRIVETTMYPPTPTGAIRMADVASYLGMIKGNRIILTHSAGMDGSYSTTFEEFSQMDSPLEIIYRPGIVYQISFNRKDFCKSND